jgi:hypothetical protein
MCWIYNNLPVENIEPQYKCFVYCITNKISGRKYIGLKTTSSPKYKVLKGVRKKNGVKDSDWRDYWSSSVELQNDVVELGKENFLREILYFCKLKAHSNYLELREQMDRRVLEHPELYYNRIVNARVSANHIKSLDMSKLNI